MNFLRRLLEEIFSFQATVLKFCDLLAVWKLPTNANYQHNISKIRPAMPKNIKIAGPLKWCEA